MNRKIQYWIIQYLKIIFEIMIKNQMNNICHLNLKIIKIN